MIILALKTNIGDARQRAEEQMGNKSTTLKRWKNQAGPVFPALGESMSTLKHRKTNS